VDIPVTAHFAGARLFERVPDTLFAPLASPNRRRYWQLLCQLYQRRFGPDAPLPPVHGFPRSEITQEIAHNLTLLDAWEDDKPDTPLPIRAIEVFNTFRDAGWFRLDRIGVREMVTMRPAVGHFMDRLLDFAERGPVFVSGKVRAIELQLQNVRSGQDSGDVLGEAASQARHLMEYVRNTGTNVRDIMESVSSETSTREYVKRFFTDFIQQVFIADYRELRTRDHPLSRRPQILRMVEELRASPEHRMRLVSWYENNRCKGDHDRAVMLFERDISRLDDIRRIDEYLDRLDDEIHRANKRAIAYLDYRLRSLRPIDQLVDNAVKNVLEHPLAAMSLPLAPWHLVGPMTLAEPRQPSERPQPAPLRKVTLSINERARSSLLSKAREARTVTPQKMSQFLDAHLQGKPSAKWTEFTVKSVADLRALQMLMSAAAANASGNRDLRASAARLTPARIVVYSDREEVAGPFVSSAPFEVHERKSLQRKGAA